MVAGGASEGLLRVCGLGLGAGGACRGWAKQRSFQVGPHHMSARVVSQVDQTLKDASVKGRPCAMCRGERERMEAASTQPEPPYVLMNLQVRVP